MNPRRVDLVFGKPPLRRCVADRSATQSRTVGHYLLCSLASAVLLLAVGCGRQAAFVPGSLSAEASHDAMEQALQQLASRAADENIFVGDRLARTAREKLTSLPANAPPLKRWFHLYRLAKSELHLGREQQAIQLLIEAEQLVKSQPQGVQPEILRQFYFDIAVAYLRWGETQNCCQRNAPESCIMPLQGAAIHEQQEGSRRAIRWLTLLLEMLDRDLTPNEVVEPSLDTVSAMHWAARWLLNLAYMTVGEYPQGVPQQYLLAGLADSAETDFPAWTNVAAEAGVATFSLAGGAIAEDFDNDGAIDLAVSCWDPRGELRIFWNRGDGAFEEGGDSANLSKILGGLNIVQTDYNNDGLPDIFVMRGGWLAAGGQHPNSLLRNNGDRSFTDVTATAGLALVNLPTQSAAWADYDLDGDLDLYIGNESTDELKAAGQLFQNQGDGTFIDMASSAGVLNNRMAKAVAWGDFDDDRYPDLYVSNYRGQNRLYRNQGDGTFVDVAPKLGVTGPEASFPCWFCDVNNDGRLDLFVSAYSGGIAELAMAQADQLLDHDNVLPRMYMGSEDYTFRRQGQAMGLVHPTHPMGANFGDVDADGFVDFYLGTGWPEYHELMPNMLYHNQQGQRMVNVTANARMGHLQKGHAVAMADFDNDGDLDVFEQMGGFVPGDKFYDVLYQNPGTSNRWLKIKLQGRRSNRLGIGAKIRVVVRQGDAEPTSVYRQVSSGGSFGANPLEQYIGLGPDAVVERIEVYWPCSDTTNVLTDVETNTRLIISEK